MGNITRTKHRKHKEHLHVGRVGAPAEERFFFKVVQDGDCWRWVGALNRSGYGEFGAHGSHAVRAHRWAYEYLRADIPAGLQLDHLCRNRWCVNPWHLEPVTPLVNTRRIPRLAS